MPIRHACPVSTATAILITIRGTTLGTGIPIITIPTTGAIVPGITPGGTATMATIPRTTVGAGDIIRMPIILTIPIIPTVVGTPLPTGAVATTADVDMR